MAVKFVFSQSPKESISLSTDDTHNDTSIMSFFEESSLPVYPETDEKMAVVNGISNRGGVSHNNSTSHGDSVSHGNSMTREDSTEVYEALANGKEEKSRDKETVAEETVAMATEDTSLVPNFVEVKIVEGSERNEEEGESGETQEEEIGESGEAQTTEEEAVQFIRGISLLRFVSSSEMQFANVQLHYLICLSSNVLLYA